MLKTLIASFGILTITKSKQKSLTHSSQSVDLSSVIQADFTCCHDKTNADECHNEGAYNCIWIDGSSSQFAQDLAAHDGHSCVGEAYLSCKEAAQDVTACCAGCCDCTTPPPAAPPVAAPSPVAAPAPDVCFQKVPTEEPTPQPIEPPCTLGVDYSFEGLACQISGDPHAKQHDGGKHDFQGQPLYVDENGDTLNQFYYATQCDGSDTTDMPFRILGTHHPWGDRDVSGIDYLTVELYDDNGNVYYVYLNHAIHAYALGGNAQVSTNYDDTPSAFLTDLAQNTPTDIGVGNIFELTFTAVDSNRVQLKIVIETAHGDATINIFMAGQMDIIGRSKRMHYVYISTDSLFKCHQCGLCGNFKDTTTGEAVMNLEACDGSYVQYRAGWNADNTPEAYDVWGWTYEKNFYNNQCGTTYDITDNTRGLNYVDPCDPNIAQTVANKCAAEVAAESECCTVTIGGSICADLQADCEFDACVIATDNGGTEQAMDAAVYEVLGKAIETLCAIPNVGNENNEGNTADYGYIGCYKDSDVERALRHTASMDIPNHNIGACVELCAEYCDGEGSAECYMGLQYDKECFCDISLDIATKYGVQTKTERCGEYQPIDERSKHGCWGGRWTNCLYGITRANTAYHNHKVFMSQIEGNNAMIMSVNGITDFSEQYAFIKNGYIQMGMIGAVIVLIGGVWYIKRNKNDKYISIDAQTSNV